MADYLLQWVPASPSVQQSVWKVLRYNNINGGMPFVFGANLAPAINNYLWTGLLTNVAYRFQVRNQCAIGDGAPRFPGNTYEWLEFECIPLNITNVDDSGFDLSTPLTQNVSLEGGPSTPSPSSDIINVEYSIYDATNTTLITGPTLGTSDNVNSIISYNGLPASTTYTIRYVLLATVNGVEIRSDAANQLGTYCQATVATTATLDQCPLLTISQTDTTITASVDFAGTPATSLILRLFEDTLGTQTGGTFVAEDCNAPVISGTVHGTTFTGLTPGTNYYIAYKLVGPGYSTPNTECVCA